MTLNPGSGLDAFDVYANTFGVTVTPMGGSLWFSLNKTETEPMNPGVNQYLGTVRMSNELLKLLTYFLHSYIIHQEYQLQVEWPVPNDMLERSNISPTQWAAFWGYDQ